MAILKKIKTIDVLFDDKQERDESADKYEKMGYMITDWINSYSNVNNCEVYGFVAELK